MIYEKISKICSERKLAITALESQAGLGRGAIGKWKIKNNPSVRSVQKVAKALEVPIETLIGDGPC